MSRSQWRGGVPGRGAVAALAVMAVAVAGCAAHPSSAADGVGDQARPGVAVSGEASTGRAPLPAGEQGTRQQVPWPKVGPGWFVAQWSRQRPHVPGQPVKPKPVTLFLVDPAGGRYSLMTVPWSSPAAMPLVDWSGDGQRLLLQNGASAVVLDLRSGAISQFFVGESGGPLGFTAPDGLAVLANSGGGHPHLERFSLTGQLQHSYPSSFGGGGRFSGSALDTPDGTRIAVSTTAGVELLTNAGQPAGFLPVSKQVNDCHLVRWWTTSELLAGCFPRKGSAMGAQQLWLVPTSGARPAPLTASPPARGDNGDLTAWPIPAGVYLTDAGACGVAYVAKLKPDHRTTPISVPGVTGGSTSVIGAYHGTLALRWNPPCGAGAELMWFSPEAGMTKPLLGPHANGGGVAGVLAYGADDPNR